VARGRAKSKERIRAHEIWLKAEGKIKLKDIAAQIGVSDNQIRQWKKKDGWVLGGVIDNGKNVIDNAAKKKAGPPLGNKNALGHGAPFGNKNALGNNGGAPKRNKNAVRTGEHETIWLDQMSAAEREMFQSINTDPLAQIDENIRLLTYRERRMLSYLNELRQQKELVETKSVFAVKDMPAIGEVYDEKSGTSSKIQIKKPEKVLVSFEESRKFLMDKIIRIEEALTRVQEKKIKAINAKQNLLLNPVAGASADDKITFTFKRGGAADDD
jgi:uncharacterized protein YjcR